jgi:hypothetical protein
MGLKMLYRPFFLELLATCRFSGLVHDGLHRSDFIDALYERDSGDPWL